MIEPRTNDHGKNIEWLDLSLYPLKFGPLPYLWLLKSIILQDFEAV